jgi:hypothetical protein
MKVRFSGNRFPEVVLDLVELGLGELVEVVLQLPDPRGLQLPDGFFGNLEAILLIRLTHIT